MCRSEPADGQGVDIEADKAAFEMLTLGVAVQVVRTKVAPTLKRYGSLSLQPASR